MGTQRQLVVVTWRTDVQPATWILMLSLPRSTRLRSLIHEPIFIDLPFLFKIWKQGGISIDVGPVELGLMMMLVPVLLLAVVAEILWSMGAVVVVSFPLLY